MKESNRVSGGLKFSVVIPVFNEAENLKILHTRLTDVMRRLKKPYEIIYVDDGSRDDSFQILKSLHAQDKNTKVIRFARNFGQHPAVMAGFEAVRGEMIITLDADMQNPPEEIPKLLAKLNEGYEVVNGYRENRHDLFWRKMSSRLSNWLMSRVTGVKLKDYGSMFRIYKREIIEMVKLSKEHSRFITALVSWLGASIAEVEVAHDSRYAGQSKYNVFKMLKMYYDLITGFTIFPIQFVTYLGFIFAFIGFAMGIYLLIYRLLIGPGISGFVTFAMIGFFLFGILLVAIGLIGEYIARIFIEVRGRPYYIIKESLE
jgi:undecaprenyl-phosphate 4-deoxy-4-formamido-L-arabinose transferase